ncbi:hypothetical protein SB724_20475, partial [Bacillus sp. SIMBA_031]
MSTVTIESRATMTCTPSKNFDCTRRFYQDLGFTLAWAGEQLAYFQRSDVSFRIQNFYFEALADNFM